MTGTTTTSRKQRNHPPPDTSKTYDTVQHVQAQKKNPIVRWLDRMGTEVAFGQLQPSEKVVTFILLFVVSAVLLGLPLYVISKLF